MAGTPGAEFHPDLQLNGAQIVQKGTDPEKEAYSGFQGTDLAQKLRAIGIRRVFIAGLTTDYCVRFTALDALANGFKVVVLVDAIRGVDVNPGDSEAAIEEMRKAGAKIARFSNLI